MIFIYHFGVCGTKEGCKKGRKDRRKKGREGRRKKGREEERKEIRIVSIYTVK